MKKNILYFFYSCLLFSTICGQSLQLNFNIAKEDIGITGGLSENFLRYIQQFFQADALFETGTYQGVTTQRASPIFNKVYTVELSEKLFQESRKKLKDIRNIIQYQGASYKAIYSGAKNCAQESVIFWLDAHWSGANTAQGEKNTPVLEEIDAVAATRKNKASDTVILIDDLRFFRSAQEKEIIDTKLAGLPYYGYPTVDDLRKALLSFSKEHDLVVYGDILMYYPKKLKLSLSKALRGMTVSRLFDSSELYSQQDFDIVVLAENDIAFNSTALEKAAIKHLYKNLYGGHAPLSIYKLWYGLVLLGEGASDEAKKIFNELKAQGIPLWRIAPYTKYLKD